jgi:hypothetical protein
MAREMDKAGWAWPPCSRKAHYFAAGSCTSLCRKVGFVIDVPREEGNDGSRDNCAKCQRLLAAEKEATAHLAM